MLEESIDEAVLPGTRAYYEVDLNYSIFARSPNKIEGAAYDYPQNSIGSEWFRIRSRRFEIDGQVDKIISLNIHTPELLCNFGHLREESTDWEVFRFAVENEADYKIAVILRERYPFNQLNTFDSLYGLDLPLKDYLKSYVKHGLIKVGVSPLKIVHAHIKPHENRPTYMFKFKVDFF